jgi:hypothetical protein
MDKYFNIDHMGGIVKHNIKHFNCVEDLLFTYPQYYVYMKPEYKDSFIKLVLEKDPKMFKHLSDTVRNDELLTECVNNSPSGIEFNSQGKRFKINKDNDYFNVESQRLYNSASNKCINYSVKSLNLYQ